MASHGPSQGPALPTMALPPADGMTSAQLGRAAMAMARQTGPRPSSGVSWGGVLEISGDFHGNFRWKRRISGDFLVIFMEFDGTLSFSS